MARYPRILTTTRSTLNYTTFYQGKMTLPYGTQVINVWRLGLAYPWECCLGTAVPMNRARGPNTAAIQHQGDSYPEILSLYYLLIRAVPKRGWIIRAHRRRRGGRSRLY